MARSIDGNARNTVTLAAGQRAHPDHVAQSDVVARRFETPLAGVWSLVGNGLSNQTFVRAPDGIIAIDTGESVEEMRAALGELRLVERAPIVAVMYTHFHYVEGTTAITEEDGNTSPLPVIGHERIAANRARATTEIGPAYSRGLVEQFAIAMPTEGPDGLVNVGLGRWYRNPEHAPFTPGHVPVSIPLHDGSGTISVGGETIEWAHAPSDADDSVNFYFPSRGLCVNNTVWPALFNIYAIRGEEYRDPRRLLDGFDRILGWSPEHLIGAHGPCLSGRDLIRRRVIRARDAIQFLWDQTVRGINKGWTTDELAERVTLPAVYDEDYLTSERYGVAEHHVRQIHAGLRGWFDGDESKLFPIAPDQRHSRLIEGFGGRDVVRAKATDALAANDVRWATELATWLVRSSGSSTGDRDLLARCLRMIAERTPAANIRNWAITRARHLDGSMSMERHYQHRFGARSMRQNDDATIIATLRVTLEPAIIEGLDHHVAFLIDGNRHGLHVRNGVAVPTDGMGAHTVAELSRDTLISVMSGRVAWSQAARNGDIRVTGDSATLDVIRRAFEVDGLRS